MPDIYPKKILFLFRNSRISEARTFGIPTVNFEIRSNNEYKLEFSNSFTQKIRGSRNMSKKKVENKTPEKEFEENEQTPTLRRSARLRIATSSVAQTPAKIAKKAAPPSRKKKRLEIDTEPKVTAITPEEAEIDVRLMCYIARIRIV